MCNANLLESKDEVVPISVRKEYEANDAGMIFIEQETTGPIFVYDKLTKQKIARFAYVDNTVYLNEPYKEVIIDYQYNYHNSHSVMSLGRPLITGFLSLEGRARIKDDITGKVVTGIIRIPKLRLMSDLSMRVGTNAIPQVGYFKAVAVPEGARNQSKVMEIIFLNDDIDADI